MTDGANDAHVADADMRRIALIAFTEKGCSRALELVAGLNAAPGYEDVQFSVSGPTRFAQEGIEPYESLGAWTQQRFDASSALVFVSATGIAVRAIAPYVRDKFSDPAVVSVDEKGLFAVPLLSGHVGGANELARDVARVLGGVAVVSTATDVNGLFAVDEWARRRGFAILERSIAKEISARLLAGETVGYVSDFDLDEPFPANVVAGAGDVGFAVTLDEQSRPFERTLHLVPRCVTIGVGCRKGVEPRVLADAVDAALAKARISAHAVGTLASIDVKRGERAIEELARLHGWDLVYYTAEELQAVPGNFSASQFVKRTVGVDNVCERAALARGGSLVLGKQAGNNVTVAIAVGTLE